MPEGPGSSHGRAVQCVLLSAAAAALYHLFLQYLCSDSSLYRQDPSVHPEQSQHMTKGLVRPRGFQGHHIFVDPSILREPMLSTCWGLLPLVTHTESLAQARQGQALLNECLSAE